MAKLYHVGASSFHGTYTAGVYVAELAAEAIEMAKADYRNSPVGREVRDVGAYRFYIRNLRKENDE